MLDTERKPGPETHGRSSLDGAGTTPARPRRPRSRATAPGLTVVELLVALGVLALITGTAMTSYRYHMSTARRTEGVLGLNDIGKLQSSFYSEHGHYARNVRELGYAMDQGGYVNDAVYQGRNYKFYTNWRDDEGKSYQAVALGNIDGDEFDDVLVIWK